MTFKLSSRSLRRLDGVHPDLIRVVHRAIEITTVDFGISEGLRTKERQLKLFQAGATKIMESRHLTGHAVDLYAWAAGEVRWDWPLYFKLADAMRLAAKEEDVPIRWGGDWDGDGDSNDESFRDGPHFELPRKLYPT